MHDSGDGRDAAYLPLRWSWWFRWVLANAVVGSMGSVAAYALASAVGGVPSLVVAVAVTWAAVGLAQWQALRSQVQRARAWVLADVAGGTAGAILALWTFLGWLSLFTAVSSSALFAIGVIGVIAGAFVGIAQWRVLRTRILKRGSWLALNAAAGAVGWIAGWSVSSVFGIFTGSAAGWAAGAAVTGLALKWLLRGSAPAA